MFKEKLISVIIPVFNTHDYLKKCIDSILGQTYKKMQIIIVDDGSTDDSSELCDYYALNDSRIEVVHQSNLGLVAARIAGIKKAEGDYILNIDSDDWIESNYIEEMYLAICENDVDMIASNLFFDIGNDKKIIKNGLPIGIYRPMDIFDRLIYNGIFFEYGIQPHLVTKLIKKEIAVKNQISVDIRIKNGEDAAVTYPCIMECQKILISDICGYHYVQHQSSMTKACSNDMNNQIKLLIDYLKNRMKSYGLQEINNQLNVYERYLKTLHYIQSFDEKVLLPFGGIPYGSRIILYGAGGLGQQIYKYISEKKEIRIVKWVDKNFLEYQNQGMQVDDPYSIMNHNDEFDFVIIANISKIIGQNIKNFLAFELDIEEEKIRWLSKEFTE